MTVKKIFFVVVQVASATEQFKCILGTATGCSTDVALGLTKQIAAKMTQMGMVEQLDINMEVDGFFRSIAQHYLVYNWNVKGICGSIYGIDPSYGGQMIILDNDKLKSQLAYYGWLPLDSQYKNGFEYKAAPDSSKQNYMAFQKLHNINNPENKISEDGIVTSDTEKALYNAPCDGYSKTTFPGEKFETGITTSPTQPLTTAATTTQKQRKTTVGKTTQTQPSNTVAATKKPKTPVSPPQVEKKATCILGTATGCSTDVALGLTKQIVAKMSQMGFNFTTLDSTWIKCKGFCFNQLLAPAASDLLSAAKSKNDYITLNSAFRSSAQQYLLWYWYYYGKCDLSLVDKPGTSNHEGGRAIDIANDSYWLYTLDQYGWKQTLKDRDPVHFEYTDVQDYAKYNLLAFQRLYNINNPTKKISEDGIFGPATDQALQNAPCDGYSLTTFPGEKFDTVAPTNPSQQSTTVTPTTLTQPSTTVAQTTQTQQNTYKSGIESQCILGSYNGCSFAFALGLTKQITAKMTQMGHTMKTLDSPLIKCKHPNCNKQLLENAANALLSAVKSKNEPITISFFFLSSADAYLWYKWYEKSMCGVNYALLPGGNAGEQGGVIEVAENYEYWQIALQKYGWTNIAGFLHMFEYKADPGNVKYNLMAFQKLHNINNPENKISEDGIYSLETAKALYNAPCDGYSKTTFPGEKFNTVAPTTLTQPSTTVAQTTQTQQNTYKSGIESQCILGSYNGCSTAVALGLTKQITAKMTQMGYTIKTLDSPLIECKHPNCNMQLLENAANALLSAVKSNNEPITISFFFVSSADVYLWYKWYEKSMCGVNYEFLPGGNAYEQGGVIVVAENNEYWQIALQKYGWTNIAGYLNVFEYKADPGNVEYNLMAFQKLHNINNPENKISEDGIYSLETAKALYNAPCDGYSKTTFPGEKFNTVAPTNPSQQSITETPTTPQQTTTTVAPTTLTQSSTYVAPTTQPQASNTVAQTILTQPSTTVAQTTLQQPTTTVAQTTTTGAPPSKPTTPVSSPHVENKATCILGTAPGCSTDVALGITKQIVAKMNQMGFTFTTLDSTWIKCQGSCFNQLLAPVASALLTVAKAENRYITLNSAFRSTAQQYLLIKWKQFGKCNLSPETSLVAKPGTSNHEGGRAIDITDYDKWMQTLENYNWKWKGASDIVHFDYLSVEDYAKYNLMAFQRLYNINNPNNKISEDGIFGPATETALYNAPCDGYSLTTFPGEKFDTLAPPTPTVPPKTTPEVTPPTTIVATPNTTPVVTPPTTIVVTPNTTPVVTPPTTIVVTPNTTPVVTPPMTTVAQAKPSAVTACVHQMVLKCLNGSEEGVLWPVCSKSMQKDYRVPSGYEYGYYCEQNWIDSLSEMLSNPVVNMCGKQTEITNLLAQVASESGFFSTTYSQSDGGAGLIHMTPANQAINAADMDKLWPGNDYAGKLNKMGKSFFQTPEYAWRSVAAWYKLTNRVIKNCGLDLFTQPYETQTRCIVQYSRARTATLHYATQCMGPNNLALLVSSQVVITSTSTFAQQYYEEGFKKSVSMFESSINNMPSNPPQDACADIKFQVVFDTLIQISGTRTNDDVKKIVDELKSLCNAKLQQAKPSQQTTTVAPSTPKQATTTTVVTPPKTTSAQAKPSSATDCVQQLSLRCMNEWSRLWPICSAIQKTGIYPKTAVGPSGYEYGNFCEDFHVDELNKMLSDPVANMCGKTAEITNLLAQVASETGYFTTTYSSIDGSAGLIRINPANWAINADDMDKLWPGNDYAGKLKTMGKYFFQTSEYAWRSVAAWYKLTNRVIKNCGLDLFTQPYETQTRCILGQASDRSEILKVANVCNADIPLPERKTAITSAVANYCSILCSVGKVQLPDCSCVTKKRKSQRKYSRLQSNHN